MSKFGFLKIAKRVKHSRDPENAEHALTIKAIESIKSLVLVQMKPSRYSGKVQSYLDCYRFDYALAEVIILT